MLYRKLAYGKQIKSCGKWLESTSKNYDCLIFKQTRRRFHEYVNVVHFIQNGLLNFQQFTHLPWWSSFAISTILVRLASFPILSIQVKASSKLSAAVPEVTFLFQLLKSRLQEKGTLAEKLRISSIFFKGVRACLNLHEVSIMKIILPPLSNICMFVTFIYSIRGMMYDGLYINSLENGGFLWFQDLTSKDSTFLLPLAAISCSYAGINVSFKSTAQLGRTAMLMKDMIQSIMILSVPFVTALPAGVFCYWIPSSLFTIMHHIYFRSAVVRKVMK